MKLQIVSDLHLDAHNFPDKIIEDLYTPYTDVLVVAGDIITNGFDKTNSPVKLLKKLAERFITHEILYVPGNHDFYGTSIADGLRQLREPIASNLHVLYNEAFIIGKQTFLGTTLWFKPNPLDVHYRRSYPDFTYIKNFATTYEAENAFALKWLDMNMNAESIVITHFTPHPMSVHERYRGDDFNMFFVCDISETIDRAEPKIVVHGHTHDAFDYKLDHGQSTTRVICNPYGYKHERYSRPFKSVVVEV